MAYASKQKGRGDKRRVDSRSETSAQSGGKYDENSPIIQAFRMYQKDLDTKHDKHERLVKLSRDVTIESKRAIFLLQRVSGLDDEEADNLLKQAETKLEEVRKSKFEQIAKELMYEDPYQFLRAFSPGMQEYVEAVSLLSYLKDEQLISLSDIAKDLQFEVHPETSDPKDSKSDDSSILFERVKVHLTPLDYMLGVADMTGEVMRIAINSVGAGDLDSPFKLCHFLRLIHDAFVSFSEGSRELQRKLSVLRQSLKKVETACYTIKVRGSEIPKHMLADVFKNSSESGPYDNDEL